MRHLLTAFATLTLLASTALAEEVKKVHAEPSAAKMEKEYGPKPSRYEGLVRRIPDAARKGAKKAKQGANKAADKTEKGVVKAADKTEKGASKAADKTKATAKKASAKVQ